MHYAESILDLVGDTPLVRLTRIPARDLGPLDAQPLILAKLETLNPGGSVKDRIGLPMIEAAERAGLLKPGGTIIEPTSGNTGHGLAIAAALKGYRCIFVMADKQSTEKQALLRAYGAEVVLCPTNVEPESPESYYSVAARLARDIPGAFKPDQYWNQENPTAHEATTGPEIWDQTEGRITHFVASVGTGGTVTGDRRATSRPRTRTSSIVGADPEGSVLSGDTARPYLTEGVGEDFFPGTYDADVVDRWVRVSDRDAFAMARRITREEGILAGESCGTAMVAALDEARRLMREEGEAARDRVIVVIFPDGGRNYLSKLYNDEWMRANGLLTTTGAVVRVDEVLRARHHGKRAARRRRSPARRTASAPRSTCSSCTGSASCPSRSARTTTRSRGSSAPSARRASSTGPTATRASSSGRSARSWTRRCPTVDVGASIDDAFALLSGGVAGGRRDEGRPSRGRRHEARPPGVPGPPGPACRLRSTRSRASGRRASSSCRCPCRSWRRSLAGDLGAAGREVGAARSRQPPRRARELPSLSPGAAGGRRRPSGDGSAGRWS